MGEVKDDGVALGVTCPWCGKYLERLPEVGDEVPICDIKTTVLTVLSRFVRARSDDESAARVARIVSNLCDEVEKDALNRSRSRSRRWRARLCRRIATEP